MKDEDKALAQLIEELATFGEKVPVLPTHQAGKQHAGRVWGTDRDDFYSKRGDRDPRDIPTLETDIYGRSVFHAFFF